jgi:Sodium/calcium exchanger protein
MNGGHLHGLHAEEDNNTNTNSWNSDENKDVFIMEVDPLLRERTSPSNSNRRGMPFRSKSVNQALGRNQDEAGAAMNYIWTVKKMQRQNRLERFASARSGSFLSTGTGSARASNANTPNNSERGLSERTPLCNNEENKDENKAEDEFTTALALFRIVCGKGILSYCLLAMPFSLWAVYNQWSDTWIFWLNFVVMIPLAAMLGDFTEEVALHTNDVIGGLINASFGNAVEVVVAIQALLANEIRVVQASMLGSIFSNLLLVLGSCFFFGGLFHKEQTFNTTAATANISLLALSSIALVLPTPFAGTTTCMIVTS